MAWHVYMCHAMLIYVYLKCSYYYGILFCAGR